jgi:GTP-binding protein
LCTTASQAGREARKLRNKGSDTRVTRRYALYGDVGDAQRDVLGFNGGVKAGVKFIAAATDERSLPPSGDDPADAIPEVAFAGRSNVGKSSLINAVTLSSAARSSDVPGKTQSLNFYDVSRRLRVVDMPGYGFAFAKRERVEAWNRLMDAYLTNRANLKRVYVVVDARHGLKAPDREMLAFLSKYGGVAYGVVLNKTDLVKPADLARRAFLIREELRVAKRARAEVHMASTSTGAGVAELGAEILAFARETAPGGADAANDRTSERVTFAPRPDDDDEDEIARERSSRGGVGGGASSRGGRTAVDEAFERAGYDDGSDEDEDGSRSYAGGEWVPGGRPSGARARRGRGRGRR